MEKGTLSDRVLACALKVHKKLGVGFLEKVYENALMIELRKDGLLAERQKPLVIQYEGEIVGEYTADVIVEGQLLIELKAVSRFTDEHSACWMNYLRATSLPVCLLLNFGRTTLQIKRIVGDSYINHPTPI